VDRDQRRLAAPQPLNLKEHCGCVGEPFPPAVSPAHRSTIRRIPSLASGANVVSAGGGSFACNISTPSGVSARNGGRPART